MRTLIIGAGEVGKALYQSLRDYFPTIIDIDYKFQVDCEIMHICFPFSVAFEKHVKEYQEKYKPKYTVIHSTVPVNTSRKLNAIHSPVIGIHPHLKKSLETFTKFLGGEQASEVADYFRKAGMKVYITDKSETTELMKILDTTHYGIEIEFVKEVKTQCDKYKVPSEMWTLWVENYNKGYNELGYPEYCKPNLIPIKKKIGGHCIIKNCELLNSCFTKLIIEKNEKSKKEKMVIPKRNKKR